MATGVRRDGPGVHAAHIGCFARRSRRERVRAPSCGMPVEAAMEEDDEPVAEFDGVAAT